jgi:multiple sugar transport system permease protein
VQAERQQLGRHPAVRARRHKRSAHSIRRTRPLVFMLLPALGFLFAMSVYPTVRLWQMALSNLNLLRPGQEHFVGLENFGQIAGDSGVIYAFLYTALFVGVGVASEFALGLALALLLRRLRWFQGLVRTAVFLPMVVPPVVVGLTWRLLYDPDLGMINYLLGLVGVKPIAWLGDPAIARWAIILVDVWEWAPFLAIIYLAGLQSVPTDLEEAARVDGASAWQQLRGVTLPLLKPILIIGVLFRLIDAIKTFDLVYTTTKGGPGTTTELFSLKVFDTAFLGFDLGYAAALSALAVIIVTVASGLLLRLMPRG